MSNEETLRCLNQLLAISGQAVEFDSRFLIFKFEANCDDQIAGIVDALRRCEPSRIDDAEIVRSEGGYIQELAVAKDGLTRVYRTFQAFYNDYFKFAITGKLKAEHQDFFLDTRAHPCEDLYQKIETLQSWVGLFKIVAQSFIYGQNNNEIKFYLIEELEDEKKIKSHEAVLNNGSIINQLGNIAPFSSSVFDFGADDVYAIEKRLVCKSALLKTIKSHQETNSGCELLQIILNPAAFIENFQTGYEFYTSKYSIDKFTREIETAKIEYFEKINAIIHDNQAKALSIPVVILGTSLLRSWDTMSAILIFTAMVLALYLVTLNLEHKITAIDDCETSARRALAQITSNTRNENNLEGSANTSKNVFGEIQEKAKSARTLLKNIRLGTVMASIVWVIYMVCFYLNSTSTCPLS